MVTPIALFVGNSILLVSGDGNVTVRHIRQPGLGVSDRKFQPQNLRPARAPQRPHRGGVRTGDRVGCGHVSPFGTVFHGDVGADAHN